MVLSQVLTADVESLIGIQGKPGYPACPIENLADGSQSVKHPEFRERIQNGASRIYILQAENLQRPASVELIP